MSKNKAFATCRKTLHVFTCDTFEPGLWLNKRCNLSSKWNVIECVKLK